MGNFLSVAMCTYNGEQYLQEQIDSILLQTRLPDEVVVCDDGSTDKTLQILKDFRRKASFPVRIYENEVNLGPTKNFEQAISLCMGNIIALSDQDDVWMPDKIEMLEKALDSHPDAGYVFSDALVVDERLGPLGYTMWEKALFSYRQRWYFEHGQQLRVLLKHNIVTGATLAFRSELRDLILPIPSQWVHDAWIALLMSAVGRKGIFIDKPLIKYRQHPKQVIGGRKLSFVNQVRRASSISLHSYKEQFKFALDRLSLFDKIEQRNVQLIKAKLVHLEIRDQIHKQPRWKRCGRILKQLLFGYYHQFSGGWKSVWKDLCL